jgi:hypothetical protein
MKPASGPTFGDAKARALVRLPDGREGKLLHITRHSQMAKVVVGGRHVRVLSTELVVVEPKRDAFVPEGLAPNPG